jgi:hypothetical protein
MVEESDNELSMSESRQPGGGIVAVGLAKVLRMGRCTSSRLISTYSINQ